MNIARRTLLQLSIAAGTLAAPHVARAASRKLRIGHNNSVTSALQAASLLFQRAVSEGTDGRLTVDISAAGQLGSDMQLAKSVADGTLDMTISAMPVLGIFERDLELAEIPYLFKSQDDGRKALDGALGAHFVELLAKHSLTVIGWGENGMRHVTANKPVRTVSDLKNLKIRVQPAKLHVESFNGLGAVAAPLPFTELPEALRTGRFEAQENPFSILTANEFIPKYQSHISLTGHVYSAFAILFSSDVLEELSPADRAVIVKAGTPAARATREFNEKAVTAGLEKLRAGGMTIVTDVDVPGFQKAMEAVTPRLASLMGAEAIARVRGLIA